MPERLRDCFDVSVAVEELFTPERNACCEQADPTQSWNAVVSKAPQPVAPMVWSFSLNRIPLHASGWIQERPSDDAEREDCTLASEGVDWKQGSALVFKRLREKICRVGIVRFWPNSAIHQQHRHVSQPLW